MARLTKVQHDAVLADHALGYTVLEVAARNGVHRNTVTRVLAELKPAAEAATAEAEKAAVWAAYLRVVACPSCGRAAAYNALTPNVFWQHEPCAFLVCCPCGDETYYAMRGREAAMKLAVAERKKLAG